MHRRIRILLISLTFSGRCTAGQWRLPVLRLPGRALWLGIGPSTNKTWKLEVEWMRIYMSKVE